ncbi:uncharacterized protein METZ01_LOCUS316054, partial [marine metagenome]
VIQIRKTLITNYSLIVREELKYFNCLVRERDDITAIFSSYFNGLQYFIQNNFDFLFYSIFERLDFTVGSKKVRRFT